MTKIIPRDLIRHLEWQPGQPTAPITPIPDPSQNASSFTDNPAYSFLEGDFGRQVLEEYNQLVQGEFQNASALQKLSIADNVVKGSNPFAFVLLNRVLQNHGKWVARPADLEKALEIDVINLSGTYGDSGLVLRSESDPNEYLAGNLASQLSAKGHNLSGGAIMVPLAGLELQYDAISPHKLAFRLTDSSEIIYASQLNESNHGKKFNRGDEKGIPIFEYGGSRTLYSSESNGLCRLSRGRYLVLNARNRNLASSSGVGRVIACAEGTSP
jgi:hypothetical protein